MREIEFVRRMPEHVDDAERHGFEVAGASLYADMQPSVLLARRPAIRDDRSGGHEATPEGEPR